jgi:hypothetical protein
MGEVTQASNERCPSWVVTSDDGNGTTEVTGLGYSTLGGTNATKTAQITGLSILNGSTYSLSWTSDRGLVQTNGSSRRIGIGFVQIATTAAGIVSNAPVVSSPTTLSATVGVPVSYQITASESPTGYWAQNIPSGLTLNPSSGVISGTLLSTNANASTMVVTAYNAAGDGNQNVVLTVAEPVKTTPTLTVAPSASAITVGQALSVSTLTGGSASVAGAFAWTIPATVPPVGTASYEVTFTPADTLNYNTFTTTVSVTVNPVGTTYSGWLTGASPSDAAFLDYVFGAATPGTLDPSLRPTVAVTGPNLVLTYYVRQGTVGLTVTPKTSADLAAGPSGWVTTDVTVANVGAARTVNGVSVQQKTASVPVSGTKKFLRVEAVQQ